MDGCAEELCDARQLTAFLPRLLAALRAAMRAPAANAPPAPRCSRTPPRRCLFPPASGAGDSLLSRLVNALINTPPLYAIMKARRRRRCASLACGAPQAAPHRRPPHPALPPTAAHSPPPHTHAHARPHTQVLAKAAMKGSAAKKGVRWDEHVARMMADPEARATGL